MKKILCILSTVVFFSVVFGQGVETAGIEPNTKLTTDYDVDLHTGVLDITVPLTSVSTPNIAIPIVANYKARGIKVDQVASEIGLGWHFYGGPIISREVRGLPDCRINFNNISIKSTTNRLNVTTVKHEITERSGYLYGLGTGNKIDFKKDFEQNTSSYASTANFVKKIYTDYNLDLFRKASAYDTESDIFTLALPSGTVKFIIDPTAPEGGKIKTLGLSNVKIEFDYGTMHAQPFEKVRNLAEINRDVIAFKVWDDQGNYYEFSTPEMTVTDECFSDNSFNRIAYYSSWKISKIVDASNREINFKYDESPIVYRSQNDVSTNDFVTNNFESGFRVKNVLVRKQYLKSVVSPLEEVRFLYNDHRPDLALGKLLEFVTIYDRQSQKPKKSLSLEYDIYHNTTLFNGSCEHGDIDIKDGRHFIYDDLIKKEESSSHEFYDHVYADDFRVFFKSIQEYDNQGIKAFNPYVFEYDKTPLPSRLTEYKDHWGYYKKVLNSELEYYPFPKLHIYNELNDRNRYSPYLLTNNDAVETVDKVFLKTFGGYLNYWTNQYDTKERGVSDVYDGVSAGTINKIKYPLGGSVEFLFENNAAVLNGINQEGTQTLIGGLRVNQITTRSEKKENNTGIVTQYEYNGGKVFQLPAYAHARLSVPERVREPNHGGKPEKETELEPEGVVVHTKSQVPLENMYGNTIGYDKVTVSQPGQGKTIYYYYSGLNFQEYEENVRAVTHPTKELPNQDKMIDNPVIPFAYFTPKTERKDGVEHIQPYSALDKIEVFDENGNVLKEVEYAYETKAVRTSDGSLLRDKNVRINKQGLRDSRYAWCSYINFLDASILPVKTITKDYSQEAKNKFLTTVENIDYNVVGDDIFLRSTERISADNAQVKNTYTYVVDYELGDATIYDNAAGALYFAQQKRLLQLPVETITEIKKPNWASYKVVGGSFNEYDYEENIQDPIKSNVHLSKQYSLELNNAIDVSSFKKSQVFGGQAELYMEKDPNYSLENKFTVYDEFDNLLQATGRSGITVGNVWSYNKMIKVATCIGCQVSKGNIGNEFAYDGFEDVKDDVEAQDNRYSVESDWGKIENGSTISEDAHIGNYSYRLGGFGELSKSFRPTGMHDEYVLSFWVKNTTTGGESLLSAKMFSSDITKDLPNTLPHNKVVEYVIPNTGGEWKYVEISFDWSEIKEHKDFVSIGNMLLTAQIKNRGTEYFLIDDIMFKPKGAITSYTTYDLLYGVTSTTDANNKTSKNEFDSFGRITKQRNFKGDITKRYRYSFGEAKKYSAGIHHEFILGEGEYLYEWEEVTFSAYWLSKEPTRGYRYEWEVLKDGQLISTFSTPTISIVQDYQNIEIILRIRDAQTNDILSQDNTYLWDLFVPSTCRQAGQQRPSSSVSAELHSDWLDVNTLNYELAGVEGSVRWEVAENVYQTSSPKLEWQIPEGFERKDSLLVKFDYTTSLGDTIRDSVYTSNFDDLSIKAEFMLAEVDDFIDVQLTMEPPLELPLFTKYTWSLDGQVVSQTGEQIILRLEKGREYQVKGYITDENDNSLMLPGFVIIIAPSSN